MKKTLLLGLICTGVYADISSGIRVENLIIESEEMISAEEYADLNPYGRGRAVTASNYPNAYRNGNTPNVISSGNTPNAISSGVYPNSFTYAGYDEAYEEGAIPEPIMLD